MTPNESKGLKKGDLVYWRGDADDMGRITEVRWDGVTIAWDTGHIAKVHHGDMRNVQKTAEKRVPASGQQSL